MQRTVSVIAIVTILSTLSCGGTKTASVPSQDGSYALKLDALYRISALDPGRGATPWAITPLVAGMAVAGDTAFLGINRSGGAFIVADRGGLRYIPVNGGAFFENRTVASVFHWEGRFWCHLYRNSFFDDGNAPDARVNLVSIAEGEQAFRAERLPFDADFDASWDVSGLFASLDGSWLAEMKQNGAEKTEFRHVRFTLGGTAWKEISRAEYDAGLSFGNLEREYPHLNALLSGFPDMPKGSIVLARTEASPRISAFELSEMPEGDGEQGYVLNGFVGTGGNALSTGERGYFMGASGVAIPFALGKTAPEGAEITNVATFGGKVLVSWETGTFPFTEQAGFSVIDPARPSADLPMGSGGAVLAKGDD